MILAEEQGLRTLTCRPSTISLGQMRVAIIVPVFRTPLDLLERFFRSALSQSLADIEVIAVDDASPDQCPAVLDGIAKVDRRVVVVHRRVNGRAGMARNDGLAVARGKYVLFADADDVIAPDACERLVSLAERGNASAVSCSWGSRDEHGRVVERHLLTDRRYDLDSPRDRAECYRTLNYALWNKLFRRDLLDGLRFEQFEANIGEDLLFEIAALCRARTVVTTSYVGYQYTVHSGSATGRASKGMPYLRTLGLAGERIRETLATQDGSRVGRKYADLLALKRFTTGCAWIAENPDPVEREQLWEYWRRHLREELLPKLKFYRLLGALYRVLAARGDPATMYRWTWYANRVTDPRGLWERVASRVCPRRRGSQQVSY